MRRSVCGIDTKRRTSRSCSLGEIVTFQLRGPGDKPDPSRAADAANRRRSPNSWTRQLLGIVLMLLVGALPIGLLIFSGSASTGAKNVAIAVAVVLAVGLIAWQLRRRATRPSIRDALGDLRESSDQE